jgi:thioredoxin 1
MKEMVPVSDVVPLTSENFDEDVVRSDLPVLVDYWAPWCGPCRVFGPVVEQVAAEHAGTLKVGKVNVDDEPDLAARAGVRGIPFAVLYRDGEPVASVVGALPKHLLEERHGLDQATRAAA